MGSSLSKIKHQYIIIDCSGSMTGYFPKIKDYSSRNGIIHVHGFHHDDLGKCATDLIGSITGLTDLTIPLQNIIQEIIKAKESDNNIYIIFVTDGAHNATPSKDLFKWIKSLVELCVTLSQKKTRSVVTFNIVTCGNYWDESLVAGIRALNQTLGYPMTLTVTDIDSLIKTDNFTPVPAYNLMELAIALRLIKNFLPKSEFSYINDLFLNYKEYKALLETEAAAEALAVAKAATEADLPDSKKGENTGTQDKPTTWAHFIEPYIHPDDSQKPVDSTKASVVLYMLFNGVKFNEEESNDDSVFTQFLKDFSANYGTRTLPEDFDFDRVNAEFANNNYSAILTYFFACYVLCENNEVLTMGLLETIEWLKLNKAVQIIVHTVESDRFQFPSSIEVLQVMLDLQQTSFVAEGQCLTLYRNIFFYRVTALKLKSIVHKTLQTLGQTWKNSYFGQREFYTALSEMKNDVNVSQGAKQSFTGRIGECDVRPHLLRMFGILLYPSNTGLVVPDYIKNDVKSHIGALVGMMIRFSTDAQNYDISLLFESNLNIENLTRFLIYISDIKTGGLELLAKIRYNIAPGMIHNEGIMGTYGGDDTYGDDMRKAMNSLYKGTSATDSPNPMDSLETRLYENPLTDAEIAVVFWLTGIKSFSDLADYMVSVLKFTKRKTMDNQGIWEEIYSMLSKSIEFLPNQAMGNLVKILKEDIYPDFSTTNEGVKAQYLLNFPIYVKTMIPLFRYSTKPWATIPSKKYHNLNFRDHTYEELLAFCKRKNAPEMFFLTGIKSANEISEILNLVQRFSETYHKIHSCVYHPLPTTPLKDSTLCVCGTHMFSPKPSCKCIVSLEDGKTVTYHINTINFDGKKHVEQWRTFHSTPYTKNVEEDVSAIGTMLSAPRTGLGKPEKFDKFLKWINENGGEELWKSMDLDRLRADPKAAVIIEQLSWFY